MKWITATDLEWWATTKEDHCQTNLPLLVSKLIRATNKSGAISRIEFPSGDMVRLPEWDGILEVSEGSAFIPKGISLFEIGTSKDPGKKFGQDKRKRENETLGYHPQESTFFFITPRIWEHKHKRERLEQAKGIWQDIQILDAARLEEWLDLAPSVAVWLVKEIGKLPNDVLALDSFWEEWSTNEAHSLVPELVVAGRLSEAEDLKGLLNSKPSQILVMSQSVNESIGFIAASALLFESEEREYFFSRCLKISNADSFRVVANNTEGQILIPEFEDRDVLFSAVKKGHHVIIPSEFKDGSGYNPTAKIELPRLELESYLKAMAKMGVEREKAWQISNDTSRSLQLIRHQLGFHRNRPSWSESKELLPALLAGRWDGSKAGDQDIITILSGQPYDEYVSQLRTWLHKSDPPLYQIGTKWRLASPWDAWNQLGYLLQESDLDKFENCIKKVLLEYDPSLDLPIHQRFAASLFGKERTHSNGIRDGLAQSLILLGGKNAEESSQGKIFQQQQRVDRITQEAFSSMDDDRWRSLSSLLPILAEAAPDVFLKILQKALNDPEKGIKSLLERGDLIFSPNYQTHLIRSLEILAWTPNYLGLVTDCLLKLCELNYEKKSDENPVIKLVELFSQEKYTSNISPNSFESLICIFSPTHPQTLTPYESTIEILERLSSRHLDSIFHMSLKLIPNSISTIEFNSKPRWRNYVPKSNNEILWETVWERVKNVICLCIRIIKKDDLYWSMLINVLTRLPEQLRSIVLDELKAIASIPTEWYQSWNSLRDLVILHSDPKFTMGTIPKEELDKYSELVQILEPANIILRHKWLFDSRWPNIEEFYNNPRQDKEGLLAKRRTEAVREIIQEHGIEALLQMAESVQEPFPLGSSIGTISLSEQEILQAISIIDRGSDNAKRFVEGFTNKKSRHEGIDWALSIFPKLDSNGIDKKALGIFLSFVWPERKIWDFVESLPIDVQNSYWESYRYIFKPFSKVDKLFEIEKILSVKRYFFGLDVISHFLDEIPSELIHRALKLTATQEALDRSNTMTTYYGEKLLNALDLRKDISADKIAEVEWVWLPALVSSPKRRPPKLLFERIKSSPRFYVELISLIYKPDEDFQHDDNTSSNLSPEQIISRAKHAHSLLENLNVFPGVNENHEINKIELKEWIHEARRYAIEMNRVKGTDTELGQMLFKCVPLSAHWPPEPICELVDSLNSVAISRGFELGILNRNSGRVREKRNNGDEEKAEAKYFESQAQKIELSWPITGSILREVARRYHAMAASADQRGKLDEFDM